MRNSSRNSLPGTLALMLALIGAGSPAAHRLDEYLQASRLAIDPDRVVMTLDLTPGVAVAEDILATIDRDSNRSISADEARAYSARVLDAIALDVDGRLLHVGLADTAFPAIDAVRKGEGTIRIHALALMPRLADGLHHLHYRNTHRPDIGVYLANALVPATDRVVIIAQHRHVDQRHLTVDYILRRTSDADPRKDSR